MNKFVLAAAVNLPIIYIFPSSPSSSAARALAASKMFCVLDVSDKIYGDDDGTGWAVIEASYNLCIRLFP